jgi:hypothetical protein
MPVNLLVLLGFLGWLVPTIAGLWYLAAFKEMRDEIRAIRRYIQSMHDLQQQATQRK